MDTRQGDVAIGMEIDGYRIEREVGRGATGVVYEVTRDGSSYALKLMAAGMDDAQTVDLRLRYRREAAMMGRLNHPALININKLGDWNGRPYLVMEFAFGKNLEEVIESQLPTDDNVLSIGAQLASALVEVHRYGLVHRDIKPANVVVDETGNIKLLDFGFAAGATDDRDAESDAVVGTLLYAAPEQARVINRGVDLRADLYGLGATLYHSLAGHPPFEAETAGELLQLLGTAKVPDVRSFRPAMRPLLARIVMKLLSKDPDDRYQSAKGLLWDIEHLADLEKQERAGRAAQLGTHDSRATVATEVALCGRATELSSIKQAWTIARGGELRLVQVEGESGLGKTRLVRELLAVAREHHALVLMGKGQQDERVPLATIREGVDSLLADVSRLPSAEREKVLSNLRAAAGADASVLKRLSSGLANELGDAPEPPPLGPAAERVRFRDAVAAFLRRLAGKAGGVILVIDDVQWIDDSTIELTRRLLEDEESAPLLIATTARNDAQSEPARARFVGAVGSEHVHRITLRPLDSEAVGQMMAAFLGRPLNPAMLDRVARLTRGNPFGVGEYARSLVDKGMLRPGEECWELEPEALSEGFLPRDMVQVVVKRLGALSSHAQALLGIAALLGNRFSLGLLADAARMRVETVEALLDEAVRATLLERINDEDFAFPHDKVHEAAVAQNAEANLGDIHEGIADALAKRPTDSADYVYALARHRSLGHPERHQNEVWRTCMVACELAVENRDHGAAYEFGRSGLAATSADVSHHERMRLSEALGSACVQSGRLEEAEEHLNRALEAAAESADRFRIQLLVARTYLSRGIPAWEQVYEAFDYLGEPVTQSRGRQVFSIVFNLFRFTLRRITGWGFGRAKGVERQLRRRISEAHRIAIILGVTECNTLRIFYFLLRELLNAHRLGAADESALVRSTTSIVWSTLGAKKRARRWAAEAVEIAAQIGTPGVLGPARTIVEWVEGILGASNAQRLLARVEDVWKLVPGDWHVALEVAHARWHTAFLGLTRDFFDFYARSDEPFQLARGEYLRMATRLVARWQYIRCGRYDEAKAEIPDPDELLDPKWVKYAPLAYTALELLIAMEEEDIGPRLDELEKMAKDLKVPTDYYLNMGRVGLMYCRLQQLRAAKDSAARRTARRKLRRIMRYNSLTCKPPQHVCHIEIVRAALARINRKWKRARKHLHRADRMARQCDSRWGMFNIAVERARLAADTDDPVAVRGFATVANDIALEQGWAPKSTKIAEEFGVTTMAAPEARPSLGTTTIAQTVGVSPTQSGVAIVRGGDYLEALLQVSLASSSTLDADQQASNALKELTRVLRAERALLFLSDTGTEELSLKASHGVAEGEVSELRGYSSTVVRKVYESHEAIIVSGTEEAADLGAESAVSYGLRSIIAAPLMLRDRVIGVVYLDNRMARGFFTTEHIKILTGIGNHIAVAIEMARSARIEAEKKAMERDLELTGTVQTLLLPGAERLQHERLRVATVYRPASKCGGDWWWQEEPANGHAVLLLGDVTGHGPPAAMISAVAAGAYHTARARGASGVNDALQDLHDRIREMGGQYNMTMCAMALDTSNGALVCWSAAAPPVMVWRNEKQATESFVVRGTPLGSATGFVLGSKTISLRPGDRVLAFTDGLIEQTTPNGRPIGAKRLVNMLAETAGTDVGAACSAIDEQVMTLAAGSPQEDDITFMLLEYS